MLYAIRPEGGYWDVYSSGKIIVDQDGCTLWENDRNGTHTFLIDKMSPHEIKKVIDDILNRDLYRTI